jgi:hypothetical protein
MSLVSTNFVFLVILSLNSVCITYDSH